MSLYYPMPANLTGYGGLLRYYDRITCRAHTSSADIHNCVQGGGWFGIFLLIGIFVFLFWLVIARGYRTSQAFVATSFVTMWIAVFLRLAGALDDSVVTVLIGMFLVGLALAYRDKGSNG